MKSHEFMSNTASSPASPSFLESLKGKTVTIYRGGPESKTGRLLDIKGDFIAFAAQNNNNQNNSNEENISDSVNGTAENENTSVIYYNTRHIKSISEDTKSNSIPTLNSLQESPEYINADNFLGLVGQLKDEYIQINQGGPEAKRGILLGASGDHAVMYTEDDGNVYYNLQHVKSISKYQNQSNDEEDETAIQETPVYPEYVSASSFHDVFKHMSHKWVSINRGGPESMEGVLVENAGGHYTLVNNEEILRIYPYHIKSISCGPKGSLQQNNQSNEQQDNHQGFQDGMEMGEVSEESSSRYDESADFYESQESSASLESYSYRSRRQTTRSRRKTTDKGKIVRTIDYVWKGNH